ncbi:hypothetical protein Cantr_00641 [Candida viswanathii]|uniref:Uncharacterized protein n=1 Tax=Candida viswanathii TaxID=5486 RepID=A0A367YGW7_9ASCO|nr:hypothetical protein Cantr_00641 [Candida viswanathii]
MDGHIDIFRDLDASLMEILQRGQINRYLDQFPQDERNERISDMHIAIQRQRELQNQRKYYHINWCWTYIPFLVIHFDQIWRDMTWLNIQLYVMESVTLAVIMLVRALRFTTFIIGSGIYFQGIVRRLFVFCDVITFSDNFIRDVFTYILKDSPAILERLEVIQYHDGNVMYFLKYDEYNDLSSFQVIRMTYVNLVASMLHADCVITSDSATCKLLTNTLVFKFSQVLQDCFPKLGTAGLKFITLIIYLTYAIVGDIICLNVLLFLSYNLLNRFLGYKQVFVGLRNMLWSSMFTYLV